MPILPHSHKGLTCWDYTARCIYMITLTTKPRENLFGECREWGIERNGYGKAVYDAWQAIERRFPKVRATLHAIMPDHFHGMVFITEAGAVDLDDVVCYFAAESERLAERPLWDGAWRDSICLAKGQLARQNHYVLDNPRRLWIRRQHPDLFRKVLGFRHWRLFDLTAEEAGTEAPAIWSVETGEAVNGPRRSNRVTKAFTLELPRTFIKGWKREGTNWKPVLKTASVQLQGGAGATDSVQLQGGAGATADAQPQGESMACSRALAVTTAPHWTAVGNPFLLDAPLLVSVRISRFTPPDTMTRVTSQILAYAARGAVLVSPFISPGEREVKEAILAAGGSVIQLVTEGFGKYYKPAGRDFDCCAAGRMLQLSPFSPAVTGHGHDRLGKERLEWLNAAAHAISDFALGWART